MSDNIKHECGIAMIRLLKPLQYYIDKYGSFAYGLNKLYLLMQKEHNRGQDGAGVGNIKLKVQPGKKYISRYRSNRTNAIKDIFEKIGQKFEKEEVQKNIKNGEWLQENVAFTGEVLLGHLRYGTYGGNSIEQCHPFLRQNNWRTRNLVVAGNFNLTNVDELFDLLVNIGQHPKEKADTVTVMEKIGHFLDVENENLFQKYKALGYSNIEISDLIAENIDVQNILQNAAESWDGGYAMAGIMGHGDAFVLRDPSGIRPAFYYADDEIVVIASERPAIQTAFNVKSEQVKEITPGNALIIKRDGTWSEKQIREPLPKTSCSFERIYFSRGSDVDVYTERKKLGFQLTPVILNAIDSDIKNSVFSYIPNTAEVAFYGLIEGMTSHLKEVQIKKIKKLGNDLTDESLKEILNIRPRFEKVAIKDAKLRTFITQDSSRDDLVAHVYDITYGSVKSTDNLVVIDDSIVRGTTLKNSIIRILDRLEPKKIVIASSAPQIRYPDCYGIDMAKLGDFIAFQAAISLLKETGKEKLITEVYEKCKAQQGLPNNQIRNFVKEIYEPFSADEISSKITQLLTPKDVNAEVKIVYQTIEGLHNACPDHIGDWYFTGNYPTPGGNKVVNTSYINYIEGKNERAY